MLHEVDARYLCDVWDWVRDGLVKIVAKTRDDWRPEDVYTELRTGAAKLHLIYVEQEMVGFVVTQIWPGYHSGPRLFVRALWGEPHALAPVEVELMDAIRDLARKVGARAVRMNSPRRWDAREGWRLTQYIYETDV
jgi:hypothetical protein